MTSALTEPHHGEQAHEQVKHTPAPWFVESEESVCVRDHKHNSRICGLSWLRGPYGLNGRKSDEEVHANARLIAAAPDMLAALKAMHDHAVEYARINNLFNSDGSPATFHELLQARAAIAKAEGRSS